MDSDQVTIFVCVYAEIIYTTVIHGEGRFYMQELEFSPVLRHCQYPPLPTPLN